MEINKIILGNCKDVLKTLPDNSIDCCVTSPPYFGLRDYGHAEQIGLEVSPEIFVAELVSVFAEVKRVLKNNGTIWVNMGDSYAGSGKGIWDASEEKKSKIKETYRPDSTNAQIGGKKYGLKSKDLIGIPWMVAFALRSSGWYLRQDIIWHKPNPMPESVTDRCTKSHEYIFLLSKSAKYYYDHEAIKTESKDPQDNLRRIEDQTWDNKNTPDKLRNGFRPRATFGNRGGILNGLHSGNEYFGLEKANKRSVWTVNTMPYKEAHFATFPEDLIVDCIKAGCPIDGVVLDPFSGAGTTALVSAKLGRNYIGIELNPQYVALSEKRLRDQLGLFHKTA